MSATPEAACDACIGRGDNPECMCGRSGLVADAVIYLRGRLLLDNSSFAKGIALTVALRNYLHGAVGRSVLIGALNAFEKVIPDHHPQPFIDHDYPDSCDPVLNQDPELAEAVQELEAAVQEVRSHQASAPAPALQFPDRAAAASGEDPS